MNLGSKDEEGTSQEHVNLRELGAREQDPKSRQMAFQTSFRRQQRNDSQAAFQLSDPQITCLWEELEGKE